MMQIVEQHVWPGVGCQGGRTSAREHVEPAVLAVAAFHRVLPVTKSCALATTTRPLMVADASAPKFSLAKLCYFCPILCDVQYL